MKTFTVIAVAIGILAGGVQAMVITNQDMVLTIDYSSGAATLKNVGTVAHKVYLYQIQSSSTTGDLNPGIRAEEDENGSITPSSSGTWLAITDSLITNFADTTTALSGKVASFGTLTPSLWSLAEGDVAGGYALFKANSATVWSIGNPVLPNKASTSTLRFLWNDVGMSAGNIYVGQIVIAPEPATMSLLALGGLAALRRRR